MRAELSDLVNELLARRFDNEAENQPRSLAYPVAEIRATPVGFPDFRRLMK